jgi:hypothetical protein
VAPQPRAALDDQQVGLVPSVSPNSISTADGLPVPGTGGRSSGGTVIRCAFPASVRSQCGAALAGVAGVKRTVPV